MVINGTQWTIKELKGVLKSIKRKMVKNSIFLNLTKSINCILHYTHKKLKKYGGRKWRV